MNEISCSVCMDLMPLVRDGVAGEDSCRAVQEHLAHCSDCRAVYESVAPENTGERVLEQTMKRIKIMWNLIAGGFLLLGIVLCESVMQGSSMVFCLVAWIIGKLLKVTFSLEKGGFLKRIVALGTAVFLIWGVLWAGNEVFGNPVDKARAESHIQGYLDGKWPDEPFYIAEIGRDMYASSYHGEIQSETDDSIVFTVAWRWGKIIYDTYDEQVLGIWE